MTDAAGEPLMSFEAMLRPEHFMDFSKAVIQHLARCRPLPYSFGLLFVAIVASIGFQWLADDVAIPLVKDARLGPREVALLAFASGTVLAFFYVWLMGRRLTRDYAEKALREGGSYIGPRRFTLTNVGVSSAGPHGHSTTYWSAIVVLTEAPATLLLWTDPGAALIVPKEAFASLDERKRFETYVLERIAPRALRAAK